MEEQLPFFNFSLRKVLAKEPDSFTRAKLKIIATALLFGLFKLLVVCFVAVKFHQSQQLVRSIAGFLFILILIKFLLYRPSSLLLVANIMALLELGVIWSNIFFYADNVNVVTVETVFTVILISFYLLNGFKGALYTALAILPIVIYIYANGQHFGGPQTASQQLASPGFNIMVILHFITFIMCLYLYNQAVYQNLREKEILNAQLAVNVKEAKALAESRALFLSTMSHELRTPLNGVIGMTNILKATATEEQKENLNILEFSATNLMAMINDILDFNKGSLDKIELEALPVNISDLLNKVCQGLEIRAKQKGLNWGQEIDRLLKENTVVTDPTRLTQIIYNLAGNAIKFTDEGGTVTIKAKVLERTDNNLYVKLSVSDTGIGIAPDRQEEIFDPFVQASPDTTRKYGGTGLGLAIVKTLTARFGGKIELESEPGKGSVFSFSLKFPVHSGKLITNSPKQIKN